MHLFYLVKLTYALNLLFDVLGIFPERQNSSSAAIRRFFSDLSKESVAKQITIGGVSGWCVYELLFHLDAFYSMHVANNSCFCYPGIKQ